MPDVALARARARRGGVLVIFASARRSGCSHISFVGCGLVAPAMGRGDRARRKGGATVTYLPPREERAGQSAAGSRGSSSSSSSGLQQFLRDGWREELVVNYEAEARKPQAWAVGLNKVTLSFSNDALECEWRRLAEPRTRALWMRSLLSACVYQALRHAADVAERPLPT